jgi:hypothetical protein
MASAITASTLKPDFKISFAALPNPAFTMLYLIFLGGLTYHVFRTPQYTYDSLQYMGNAWLMEETDPVKLHHKVYAEIDKLPKSIREHMRGEDPGAPSASARERASNSYHFAEFLPLFSIRPLYNITLYLIAKTGLGLLRAGVFISTASYFLLGIMLFLWMTRYGSYFSAFCIAILTMMSPPIMYLGRQNTSDALASLIAFLALYLIFEKRRMFPGILLLLSSIYFRTDFLALAGPVFLALWLQRHIEFWKAASLSALALASVLAINHFGGDYGIQILYYRNFVDAPTAPAEMLVHFSFHDYLTAFRYGLALVGEGFFIPFLLLGVVGAVRGSRLRIAAAITTAYVALHFIALPNWDERWFAVFYLTMALCAATAGSCGVNRGEQVPTRVARGY